jgi:hypothetical protein
VCASLSGDVDLYVTACLHASGSSAGCVSYPNSTVATWRHSNSGADTIVIPWGSAGSCAPTGINFCTYFIGAFGFTDAAFTIVASLHNDIPTLLRDGVPQNGALNTSVADQYVFSLPAGAGFSVSLTSRRGDADLYLRLDGKKPMSNFYQYRSISAFGVDSVSVSPADFAYMNSSCGTNPCRATIAVQAVYDR